MKVDIKIPSMGESINQVTIGNLIKQTGDAVAVDDELLELETDKVNQVLYAPNAGMVEWSVAAGDVANIGQVIGTVDTEKKGAVKEVVKEVTKEPSKPPAKAPKQAPATPKPAPAAPAKPAPVPPLEAPKGTVRVTKEQFIEELNAPSLPIPEPSSPTYIPPSPVPTEKFMPIAGEPAAAGERETRKKMSTIRKVIAKRLVDVLQQTAMLTTFNEVDMTQIMALREAYKEQFMKKHNARLGFMSFFVKAAVSALKAFPMINAYISGDEMVFRNYYDIGIAVSTDRGLVVPVVRNCDELSFAQIEQAIENFAKKAREGGLSPDDLQGGGFTITNGGTYGSLLSTPILNPPQSAILGMHKISKRPVVVNDEIVIRQMMYVALSYDHRVVDGKEAVSFLVHMKNCLEDPARLFLEV